MLIFIVEDDPVMRRELKILLENAMYRTAVCESYERAAGEVSACRPDMVLLDVNLPGVSGFDLCTQIREETEVPVIFLTSRTDSMDELTGILKGGDDYITKPYQAPILLARIAAVLKRTGRGRAGEAVSFAHRGVRMEPGKCQVSCGERTAELTKSEMKILHFLFLHPGEYVPRMDLVEYLWENHIFIDDNTLSVHVARLREKLKTLGIVDFIETKRGMGYRI